MQQSFLLKNFIKELQNQIPTSYYSSPRTIQSSVGMIFKFSSSQPFSSIDDLLSNQNSLSHIQFLLTQRANYAADLNANNVVFAGGQADEGQTDLQAYIEDKCIYLGCLGKNFYYTKKRGKSLMITCHVWALTDQTFTPKLNCEQLSDFKWVDFSSIFQPKNYVVHQQNFIHFFKNKPKFIQQILNNFELFVTGLDVGMERHLWGVSLWILHYMMGMISQQLSKNPQNQPIAQNISESMEKISYIGLGGRNGKLITKGGEISLKYWQNINRKQPFTYKYKQWLNGKLVIILVVIVLMIIFYK